jgi:hypothetical protein
MAADLPVAGELLEDVPSFENPEGLVIAQSRQNRVEIVRFLRNVNDRDPHHASPRENSEGFAIK